MQQYLNILWIWFGLSKEEIKKIYYSKARDIHPDINQWINEKEMMFLNGAYNYLIENFDDYVNEISSLKTDSASYFFNEWLIVFYVAKNYELALQKFNKSLEMDSNYADAIRMKWMALYRLGDPTESIGYLSDAIEKDKKNLLLYMELIEILENENRLDEAKKVKALLKENTPKARPNMKEKYSFYVGNSKFYRGNSDTDWYTREPSIESNKKEMFNYYKLGFWILASLLVIYYFFDKNLIQPYIQPLVNQFL